MPDLVETLIEDDRWSDAGLPALAEQACRATLARLDLTPDQFEISLLACDDARISILNADFRGKPSATNVLSWPADDLAAEDDGGTPEHPETGFEGMPEELGDIAIAFETCTREAQEQGKAFSAHVTHLLVHGCLHLLGYDHIREQDAALMEGLEVEILATLGLADPYG
ncbi:rRNA maturation RNase YbeY [Actibacterium lipolyticum]|uniref:Endoribonuclease YbeY n=1 Tax=Actibacterium lipolyticum TaxID=1524263 RepID=A0A238KP20_9RHOB|nr:rRNA maturation RNase YbeY [Actibacterium lipolyticum]SMX44573.1 Endoribonuclease YbeY [Actibacterium lipolyticum]